MSIDACGPGAAAEIDQSAALATILERRSVRAFLPTPVSRETVCKILEVSSRAPSGANIQPWRVYVLVGEGKTRLTNAILDVRRDGGPEPESEFPYPPASREPYLSRRRKVGWDLYGLLDIKKGDHTAMRDQIDRNFHFFGASVGLIYTLDRDIGYGAFIELGMYMQNVMLTARLFGLDTCPQAVFGNYHQVVRRALCLPDEQMVICGMSLGFIDASATVNKLRTVREPVESFVKFVDA